MATLHEFPPDAMSHEPADNLLERAKQRFTTVVIVGSDSDGLVTSMRNRKSVAEAVMHLELGKLQLLDPDE